MGWLVEGILDGLVDDGFVGEIEEGLGGGIDGGDGAVVVGDDESAGKGIQDVAVAGLDEGLEGIDHVVEGGAEFAEFVVAVDGDFGVEIAAGDALAVADEVLDGAGERPREEVADGGAGDDEDGEEVEPIATELADGGGVGLGELGEVGVGDPEKYGGHDGEQKDDEGGYGDEEAYAYLAAAVGGGAGDGGGCVVFGRGVHGGFYVAGVFAFGKQKGRLLC